MFLYKSAEAENLKSDGVNIIIALGHSGYEVDQIIAENCPLVDLVIGGHTHTMLFTGEQTEDEVPEGLYPTVITQPKTGKKVPVVQAYYLTKYLGKLEMTVSWVFSSLLQVTTLKQFFYLKFSSMMLEI